MKGILDEVGARRPAATIRVGATVLVASVIVVLAGCGVEPEPAAHGASGASHSGQPPSIEASIAVPGGVANGSLAAGDGSFLAEGPAGVAFIRWTESDGELVGTFNYVQSDPNSSTGTASTEVSFTGLRHEGNVSLTLSQGLGTYTSLSGVVSGSGDGSVLTLAMPQPDGQLADGVFRFATISDYNTAVAALGRSGLNQAEASESAAAASQEAELEAQQLASLQAQQAGQEQAVVDGASTLAATDFSDHVQSVREAVAQASSDLDALREHAAEGPGYECVNVSSTVYNDADSTLFNDQESDLYNAVESLKTDAEDLRAQRRQLLVDVDVLQANDLAVPDGVDSALRHADKELERSVTAANEAIKSMHAILVSGYAVANALAVGDCSGEGPGSPPDSLSRLTASSD